MADIKDLITLQSLATYGGASTGVFVLTNTVRKLFNLQSPWVPFVGAQLIGFVGAAAVGALGGPVQYFVTFLNGCLLFCCALGINETAAGTKQPAPPPGKAILQGATPTRWISSWVRRD